MDREMVTEIEDFFDKGCGRCDRFDTPDCSARRWSEGLAELRRLCLAAGLEETVKWGHPCYVGGGRNVAIIGAFRADFTLTFFKAGLMKDPEGVLVKAGPNTATAGVMRFDDADAVKAQKDVIAAYLEEAKGYAEAGLVPEKVERDLELPDELVEALDDDPDLAEAFEALTPGRQRSYVILLDGAKQSATKVARIERSRDKILAGKGAQER